MSFENVLTVEPTFAFLQTSDFVVVFVNLIVEEFRVRNTSLSTVRFHPGPWGDEAARHSSIRVSYRTGSRPGS